MFVRNQSNKSKVCKILGISRSTVYYKRKTPNADPLAARVLEIFRSHNGNYGSPRIKVVMSKENIEISRRRICKILKHHNLECKHGRRKLAKNIYTATKECYIAENLIKGITTTASNEICQMDASEFKHQTGKLIVEGIIDVYDKTVVIASGASENKDLITEAITKRLKLGNPSTLHSDRGSGNISLKVKRLLESNNIQHSMSAPHKPNENQFIETFWKTAKTEIGATKHLTKEQLEMVLDYYVYYYNNERIHSSINYQTPNQQRHHSLGIPSE